jgi:hypothetical protein
MDYRHVKMTTLLGLPPEVLEAIASNLSQCDLSAFVRTTRYFYLSLTHCLYQLNKEQHQSIFGN